MVYRLILLYDFVEYVGHGIFHWVAPSFAFKKKCFFGWGRDLVKRGASEFFTCTPTVACNPFIPAQNLFCSVLATAKQPSVGMYIGKQQLADSTGTYLVKRQESRPRSRGR